MNNFVEKIISLLSTTSLVAVYSPSLKEVTNKIAAVQLLPATRNTINMLSNSLAYVNVSFAVLVKGNKNDSETVALCDEVFNKLHNLTDEAFTGGNIINIEGSTPMYVDTDDKENIIYNINFFAQVEIN